MSRRKKVVAGVVVAVLVATAVVVSTQLSRSSSTKNQEVVILNTVQRRTLQSTLALSGTLARKQIRNITAATEGLVSAAYSTDDSTAHAGQTMFALDGRSAIAETGTVPFFRSLGPGDEGNDVLQLKRILLAAGDDPGPMTSLFTEQTQFALAQWQAAAPLSECRACNFAVRDRGARARDRLHTRERCLGRSDHRTSGRRDRRFTRLAPFLPP